MYFIQPQLLKCKYAERCMHGFPYGVHKIFLYFLTSLAPLHRCIPTVMSFILSQFVLHWTYGECTLSRHLNIFIEYLGNIIAKRGKYQQEINIKGKKCGKYGRELILSEISSIYCESGSILNLFHFLFDFQFKRWNEEPINLRVFYYLFPKIIYKKYVHYIDGKNCRT